MASSKDPDQAAKLAAYEAKKRADAANYGGTYQTAKNASGQNVSVRVDTPASQNAYALPGVAGSVAQYAKGQDGAYAQTGSVPFTTKYGQVGQQAAAAVLNNPVWQTSSPTTLSSTQAAILQKYPGLAPMTQAEAQKYTINKSPQDNARLQLYEIQQAQAANAGVPSATKEQSMAGSAQAAAQRAWLAQQTAQAFARTNQGVAQQSAAPVSRVPVANRTATMNRPVGRSARASWQTLLQQNPSGMIQAWLQWLMQNGGKV